MKYNNHLFLFLLIMIFNSIFPICYCDNGGDDLFSKCFSAHYKCGHLQGIGYPFWGKNVPEFCGHHVFHLNCFRDQYPFIKIGKEKFFVLNVNQEHYKMKIVRWDLWQDPCPDTENLQDVALNYPLFGFTSTFRNLTLMYGCPMVDAMKSCNFTCGEQDTGVYNYFVDEVTREVEKPDLKRYCKAQLTIPVSQESLIQLFGGFKTVNEAVSEGFEVEYHAQRQSCLKCQESDGICGSNLTTHEFLCLQKEQPENASPSGSGMNSGQESSLKKSLIGIAGFALAGILFSAVIVCFFGCLRRNIASNQTVIIPFRKGRTNNSFQGIEKVIRLYIAPKRYSYTDVKKMTESFKNKLGQGGYGSVYKGRLVDGRPVAVKILIENLKGKRKGEEFINEVATISQTSHVNIVSLLGFCFEGHKRALIYEFMANGSLEKFIYNRNTWNAGCCIRWENLNEIAIGIARGLDYLHGGCNTRILHFDIKPHNILLDEYFRPKIADFGLSKLCSNQGSITFMEDARGTIGYIAPEVYCRSFGRVSHKSDVYSYGMMILEMVSGRKNANVRADNASKIYFPHWIYHRLQLENDLGLYSVITKDDDEVARKMILVGLWCTQTNPSQRPSMSEVLFMLEVCSEALEIPPKPFNVSPPTSGGNPSAASV